MPTVLETIGEYEEALLLMIAENWGVEVHDIHSKKIAGHIASSITKGDILTDYLTSLPEPSLIAINKLTVIKGRMPWPQFAREFGEMREMGPAKRQRERPDLNPESITESLFYKALIGKAFFDARGGPREFAFIPDEFLAFFKSEKTPSVLDQIKTVAPQKVSKKNLTNDFIIDHATTALSAARNGIPIEETVFSRPDIPAVTLSALLMDTHLLSKEKEVNTDQVKYFLEAPRAEALTILFQAWKNTESINELLLLPEIEFEKDPKNRPHFSRSVLLDLITAMPENNWYGIDEFINLIYETQPDILRKGGEYDAWFIKNRETGDYLSGYSHWKDIEGRYLRLMITGPFFWFGILDLGMSARDRKPSCFRKSRWANDLLKDTELAYTAIETKEFVMDKYGQIAIDRYFPRDIRYQLSRFCEWGAQKGNRYSFRITPDSLKRMESNGLSTAQLLSIIKKYARKPVPKNILIALDRWENFKLEAEIRQDILMSVQSPEILDQIMASTAKKFIRARLNPQTALVEEEGIPYINAALMELGIFAGIWPQV